MRRLIATIGMLAMMTTTSFAETVELTTRFSSSSVIGQNIFQLTNAMNRVQNKYDFKFASIPGAGGESAYAAGLEKSRVGTKIAFISSVSDFTFGKLEFPHRNWSENDLIFVSGLFKSPAAILVSKDSPINTVEELVASIRKKPVAYNATNVSSRSNVYLNDKFVSHYKLDTVKPLKYGPVPDIVASVFRGEADYTVFSVVDMPTLKPLAIAADTRLETMPEIPTTKELGIAGMMINSMSFISVPIQFPGLAQDMVEIMEKVCKDKEFLDTVRARKYDVSNACMKGGDIRDIAEKEYKRIIGTM